VQKMERKKVLEAFIFRHGSLNKGKGHKTPSVDVNQNRNASCNIINVSLVALQRSSKLVDSLTSAPV
jgi:hypothetical protein